MTNFENGFQEARHEDCLSSNMSVLHLCKLDIILRRSEIQTTRQLLARFLHHIDPGWKFIRIHEERLFSHHAIHFTDHCGEKYRVGKDKCSTQSLAVVLFLNDNQYDEILKTNDSYGEKATTNSWKFHHRLSLLDKTDRSKVIGDLDFYELNPDLPLAAVVAVHCGKKILRFNVFVKKFQEMKKFYENLMCKSFHMLREGFCYLTVHSFASLDIQIALKNDINAELRLTRSAVIRLKFHKLDIVQCNSFTALEQLNPRLWRTKDPEGNVLLLEEFDSKSHGIPNRRHSNLSSSNDQQIFV